MTLQEIKTKYATTTFLSAKYKERFASIENAVDAIGFLADLSLVTKYKQPEDEIAEWAEFVNILSDELYWAFKK